MKSLAISERQGWARHVAHQAYYSLLDRKFEWEIMPLALDQGVGTIVWSPLGWGRLGGKFRRGQFGPAVTRLTEATTARIAPTAEGEHLYRIVDALDRVAAETGKSVAQIAIAWVRSRPSVATVIIGARDEAQLKENLGAMGWKLTPEPVTRLEAASAKARTYPYWHLARFADRNPFSTA